MSEITVYRNTDSNITINVTGIDLANVTAATITIEKYGGAPINFSLGDGITKGATSLDWRIEDDKISNSGKYNVRLTLTENGNKWGPNLNPSFINVV